MECQVNVVTTRVRIHYCREICGKYNVVKKMIERRRKKKKKKKKKKKMTWKKHHLLWVSLQERDWMMMDAKKKKT